MDGRNLRDMLAHLKDHLLSGEGGDKIAHIILFGSHAKGTAGPDSDIDILMITLDGREVEKALLDRAYDFMLAQQAPIEIVFSYVCDLFPPQNYFLGRRFNRVLQLRNEARYRPGARLTEADAAEVIQRADALLALLAPHREMPTVSVE